MARRDVPAFADVDEDNEVVRDEVIVNSPTKAARIKGTWTMYWGAERFNFEDGKRYNIPLDLFEYLRKRGNIYDTLA